MRDPAQLKFSREHEWLSVEGDVGTIGITDFAQNELGDIVYVELPQQDARISAGGEMGTIESVKSVSELFSPVSGQVVEVNAELGNAPELVNREPYGRGWMVKVRLSDPKEVESLLGLDAYQAYVKGGSQSQ
ncbi:MAG: glycine cleavage system protein GcvH [Acidobacteriota bacterium]